MDVPILSHSAVIRFFFAPLNLKAESCEEIRQRAMDFCVASKYVSLVFTTQNRAQLSNPENNKKLYFIL